MWSSSSASTSTLDNIHQNSAKSDVPQLADVNAKISNTVKNRYFQSPKVVKSLTTTINNLHSFKTLISELILNSSSGPVASPQTRILEAEDSTRKGSKRPTPRSKLSAALSVPSLKGFVEPTSLQSSRDTGHLLIKHFIFGFMYPLCRLLQEKGNMIDVMKESSTVLVFIYLFI